MKYAKLTLKGNVKGAPDRVRTSIHSWPIVETPLKLNDVADKFERFDKAFDNATANLVF